MSVNATKVHPLYVFTPVVLFTTDQFAVIAVAATMVHPLFFLYLKRIDLKSYHLLRYYHGSAAETFSCICPFCYWETDILLSMFKYYYIIVSYYVKHEYYYHASVLSLLAKSVFIKECSTMILKVPESLKDLPFYGKMEKRLKQQQIAWMTDPRCTMSDPDAKLDIDYFSIKKRPRFQVLLRVPMATVQVNCVRPSKFAYWLCLTKCGWMSGGTPFQTLTFLPLLLTLGE